MSGYFLTRQAHERCASVLSRGDIAIDATVGNGHDTLFLAKRVGPTGTVFGFDLQATATEATARRLKQSGITNVTLLHRDHAEIDGAIPAEYHGRVAAAMFNLGYLPGGDHAFVTRPATTVSALEQAAHILRPSGILTVIAYTGHLGGREEADSVRCFFNGLSEADFTAEEITADERRDSPPILFVLEHRPASGKRLIAR